MIARSSVTIAAGGRVVGLHAEPPMTIRRVRSEEHDCATVCLVGTAAGPLPGDDVTLDITALADARVRIVSSGASIAQGNSGTRSRLHTTVTAGEHASVAGGCAPLIVAAGAFIDSEVSFELASTAALDWTEVLVLGRSSEATGTARWSWSAVVGGAPLLRQSVDVAGVSASMALAGARVVASTLLVAPDLVARTTVLHTRAVAARLADNALLLTVLGHDAVSVSDDLARLRAVCIRTAS